jgi:hypothetical protein
MIQLAAPYPAVKQLLYLPNPGFGDSDNDTHTINLRYTQDGKQYTYVKTKNDRVRLLMVFEMHRQKALEFRLFLKLYFDSQIRFVDHLERTWVGNFTINPFEFTSVQGEWQTINIEFEGLEL